MHNERETTNDTPADPAYPIGSSHLQWEQAQIEELFNNKRDTPTTGAHGQTQSGRMRKQGGGSTWGPAYAQLPLWRASRVMRLNRQPMSQPRRRFE